MAKFITAVTIQCKKSIKKNHRHWIAFSLYQKRKEFIIYYEQELNNKTIEGKVIAVFYSLKLARSFLNKLLQINNNLEKFSIDKLKLK